MIEIDRPRIWNFWKFTMFVINIGLVLAGVWINSPEIIGFSIAFFASRIVIVLVGNKVMEDRWYDESVSK